jgi:hypothetical protein
MSGFLGRRAVVVGAGIGGLSMAGALAKYFEQVEVFERDQLTTAACRRTAKARFWSVSTLCVQTADRAGAAPSDGGDREYCAAAEVPGDRDRADDERGAAVDGIRFDAGSGRSEILAADLVVDASGRGALTSTLFEALGWQRPAETEVGVDLSYATVVVATPPNAPSDWKLVLTQPDPPFLALHAVLVPIEGDRWIIAIANHHAVTRPETWDAFLEASRSLITPTVYNALRHAEPPSGIRHYRFPISYWKHFERWHCEYAS